MRSPHLVNTKDSRPSLATSPRNRSSEAAKQCLRAVVGEVTANHSGRPRPEEVDNNPVTQASAHHVVGGTLENRSQLEESGRPVQLRRVVGGGRMRIETSRCQIDRIDAGWLVDAHRDTEVSDRRYRHQFGFHERFETTFCKGRSSRREGWAGAVRDYLRRVNQRRRPPRWIVTAVPKRESSCLGHGRGG